MPENPYLKYISFESKNAIILIGFLYNKRMTSTPKTLFYAPLLLRLDALLVPERDAVANMANLAAVLYQALPDINWAGFYVLKNGVLVLGPFQGKPACVRIALGKGVCGTAAAQQKTLRVPDVHAFAGHIACDAASNSEIVVPVLHQGRVWGVLDIDSPVLNRFDEIDQNFLEQAVEKFIQHSDLR